MEKVCQRPMLPPSGVKRLVQVQVQGPLKEYHIISGIKCLLTTFLTFKGDICTGFMHQIRYLLKIPSLKKSRNKINFLINHVSITDRNSDCLHFLIPIMNMYC